MAITYINSKEIEQISNDMIKLSNDFNNEITALYKRLADVPYTTKEWVGTKAEYYFNTILLDKSDYINFGITLKKFATKLKDDVELIDNSTKKLLIEEKKYGD